MEPLLEVLALFVGLGVGSAAARLFLSAVLALAFRRARM
jgi:hypothetical protein